MVKGFRSMVMWPGYLGRCLFRYRLYEPKRVTAVLVAIMALRGLLDDLYHAFGGPGRWSMFFDPADLFGDFAQVALNYKFLFTQTLLHGSYRSWPQIFQTYLLHSNYSNAVENLANPNSQIISTLHTPPFATMTYLLAARAMDATSPLIVMIGFVLAYLLGGLLVVRAFARICAPTPPRAVVGFAAFAMCLSYPAIWMLTRANVAGFVMLLVFFYLLTVQSGRHRWAGWLALGVALNMRPEPALLVLLELLSDASWPRKLLRMAVPGLIALVVLAVSYHQAHAIYPDYTPEHIRQGIALYNRTYANGHLGDDWNVSLQIFPRMLRRLAGLAPHWDVVSQQVLFAAGALALIWGTRRAMQRQLTWFEWLFFLTALPPMSLPVMGYYHLSRILPLIVLLVLDLARNPPEADDRRLVLLGLSGLIASPLLNPDAQGPLVAVLLLTGCLFIVSGRRQPVTRLSMVPAAA
ncbi:glycosyltransferase 87 family protein [Novosphingobium terrae]|uniref:glycosyltransferase 87 family protein n=1 Tax=Novosphingobium terrae TaxID=2726189 RepID=UPI00197DE0D4|nr:glycosyltransferase 87 family protein [Novosphingobium terrae]